MSATIKQIAKAAKVSRGTVDRALNGRSGVSAETAARVKKIASEMGYKPNLAAKMLSGHRYGKQKIGIILTTERNAIYDEILQGIEAALAEYKELGIESVVSIQADYVDKDAQIDIMEQMQKEGVSGIVVTPIHCDEVTAKINKLIQNGIQVVTVNTDIQDTARMAYVGCHHKKSGVVLAELVGLMADSRKIHLGIISGPTTNLAVKRREKGFLEVLKKDYPNIVIDALHENEQNEIDSYDITKNILENNPQLDALCMLGAGLVGSLEAVSATKREKRLRVYTYDLIPEVRRALQNGIVEASITQELYKQGYEGVQTLARYILSGQLPECVCRYTEISIVTKSCLNEV